MMQMGKQIISTILYKHLLTCLLLCACYFNASAQKISATINRDKILIGDQVTLELKADDIDLTKYNLKQWFIVADTFNHIEVAQRGVIDTIKIGANTGFVQKIQLTSFDSGYWQIPIFFIALEDKQSLSTTTFNTTALPLAVLPVNVTNLKDYHDIKDIEIVTQTYNWKWIVAGVIAFLIVLFAVLWLLSKKKNVVAKPFNNQAPPHTWAMEQIEKLLQQQLLEQQQFKLFYAELIQICRSFSDAELKINTAAKTTDEYILLIKGRVGNETVQLQYFQLLRLCNAVKFAKYNPASAQNVEAVEIAKSFIHTLHQFQFKP